MSQINKEGGSFVPEEVARSRSMSRLAIVRHGDCGMGDRLNDRGRRQILALGERLALIFDREKELALILSSVAPRAVDSAKILAGLLQSPIEQHGVLWTEARNPENLEAAYALVQSRIGKADLLVVVTHFDYAELFPDFLGKRDLNTDYDGGSIGKGEGVLLDYKGKKITRI